MRAGTKDIREIHKLGPRTREWVVAGERVATNGARCARFIGYTEAGPGYEFGRIAPRFSQILVSERGEGLVLVDEQWKPCPAGFAYITASGETSAYQIRAGTSTWRLHWVIYGEACVLPSLPPGTKPQLVPVEATNFRRAVEGCCHENDSRADPGVVGLWAALVDHATWRMLDADQGDSRLDQLWVAVRRDIGGAWTLRRMAREVGMSEESLRRLCQKHLGRSPMAHLARMRMLTAADFLRHSGEKLDALAARLGYSDAFSFSTAFRRVLGVPPSEVRRRGGVGVFDGLDKKRLSDGKHRRRRARHMS